MFEGITLADLPVKQCGILRKPTNTRPIIWRIEENGIKAIVKDFSYNGFLFRNIFGRFLIWREKKAYKLLEGVTGVPACFGSIGGTALIIEEIEGTDFASFAKEKTPDEKFFNDLENLIERLHDHGIAHCDLKRAPNIMIDNDGNPYIVDWAASISKSGFKLFPLNLIYERFVRDDLNAITKIKMRYLPESVSPEEKLRYYKRSMAERFVRAIRDWLRRVIQRVA